MSIRLLAFCLVRILTMCECRDVAFIRRERLEAAGYTFSRYLPGAPDLVVEVISPNDRYTEVNDKTDEWLAAGARMVVVVNSRNRTVSVHRSTTDIVVLTEADTLDGRRCGSGLEHASVGDF